MEQQPNEEKLRIGQRLVLGLGGLAMAAASIPVMQAGIAAEDLPMAAGLGGSFLLMGAGINFMHDSITGRFETFKPSKHRAHAEANAEQAQPHN